MKEMIKNFEKLKSGSCTKSILDDLKKKGDMIFSEESSRLIYEMDNLELIELGQTSATIQCLTCSKHVREGLNVCLCGVWLQPDQDTMNRIKARFEPLITPYEGAKFHSRGRKARRQSMAKRPCESNGRHEGSKETWRPFLDTEQMAERRDIQNFSVGGRVD